MPEKREIDAARNARILEDLLGLADALPHRSTPTLEYPVFGEMIRKAQAAAPEEEVD